MQRILVALILLSLVAMWTIPYYGPVFALVAFILFVLFVLVSAGREGRAK